MSSYHVHIRAGIFLMAFVAAWSNAHSQSSDQKSHNVTRESQAIEILNNSIAKLGGLQAWTSMKGLRAIGVVQDGEKSSQVIWEDHWDGRYKMVRHTKTGDNDQKYLQNPDRNSSPTQPPPSSPRKMRPEFDPLSTLTTHAPGSAITLALNNSHYGIAVVHPQIKNGQNLDCIRIIRNEFGGTTAPVNVTLCLTHDGIPQQAMIELANVKTSNQSLYETVNYGGYTNVERQLFPSQVVMKAPLGRTRQYSFQSYVINPALNQADFEESGK